MSDESLAGQIRVTRNRVDGLQRRFARLGSLALRSAALGVVVAFLLVAVARVQTVGVCCADDAFFAHVAKNLAFGHGYASSIQPEDLRYRLKPFDPQGGAGPTLILPAAVLIRVLGNRFWVPGLTVIGIQLVLLIGLWAVLRRGLEANALAAAALTFFALAYVLTIFSSEMWFALLGEAPAALLVALGVCCWARDPGDRRCLVAGSLLLALAALCKLLSMIYVGVFLVAVFARCLEGTRSWRRATRELAIAAAVVAVPLVAFEGWKLLVLGTEEWMARIAETADFVAKHGVQTATSGGAPEAGLLLRFTRKSQKLYDHFGCSVLELVLIGATACYLAWRSGRRWLRDASFVLFVGIVFHGFWWLWVSVGRERYFVIAIVLFAVVAAFGVAAADGWRRLGFVSLLVMLAAANAGRLGSPLLDARLARQSDRLQRQAATVGFLASSGGDRPLVAPNWQAVIDLEYLLPGTRNFEPLVHFAETSPDRDFLLALNERFAHEKHPELAHVIERCERVLDLAPYRVFACRAAR
jgi:hypothetical protein